VFDETERSMSEQKLETCPCALFARATEWAALAGARWLGRDDQDAAEEAAESAMSAGLAELPIAGTIVIGPDDGEILPSGTLVGAGGEAFDLAVDPLEGRGVVARGGNGAMSMIAVGPPGSLLRLPDMYMRRIAVGPRARGRIDLTRPVAENIAAIADAFGRNANDITTLVLDRPRHHDLIEEIRAAGARIKLIQDGDLSAAMATAFEQSGVDVLMGIGSAPQGVLAAAALQCLGGDMQARLKPRNEEETQRASAMGVRDLNQVFRITDLAKGPDIMFAATGVTDGDFLKGVRFFGGGARTHSVVMRYRSGTVRFIEATHRFDRKPIY
jgi:fructose-1,6-bisphosphatase II